MENKDGTTQVGGPIKYGVRAYILRVSMMVLCRAGERMLAVQAASPDDVKRLQL
jgi:hypothetical protein